MPELTQTPTEPGNASERTDAGQRDASARAVERATWAMWHADGAPTGVAKRDPYRKLARALEAEGLLGPWTTIQRELEDLREKYPNVAARRDEEKARADAAEAKLAEIRQWADAKEASTREWDKNHNSECECEVAQTTYDALAELRTIVNPEAGQ